MPPQPHPILSFSHMFSLKSGYMPDPGPPPPTSWHLPPMGNPPSANY